ncbi:hypothetical protein [Thorsellia kenyensis]|uniref:Uncharacterized protein n=1 Tax=Thorsellia kenyensis TaxID=1549888 RepID=A0ABV6CC29_9GAMM
MKHAKGILIHSVLLHDPNSGVPVGLVYQNRWQRGAIKAESEQDAETEYTRKHTVNTH